ncbi:hypothetical protein [Actinomadura atramentaria]|uniref:hypothetical protein n=1 Tax=Actinomadura atramentaria TaxID=1990 RepID=UPI0003A7E8CF|nr:hypothetical protein [Actinomadura atramentaria]
MRFGRFRAVPGAVAVLAAVGLTAACGGNSDAVCGEAKAAYQAYMTQIRTVPAAQSKPWQAPTDQLAAKIAALAKKADDKKLRTVLNDEAGKLRTASAAVATGDVKGLNATLAETPRRLGAVCD